MAVQIKQFALIITGSLLTAICGCSGESGTMAPEQQQQLREEYERRKQPAPKKFRVSKQEEEIRQKRLRMQFGDVLPSNEDGKAQPGEQPK